MKLICFNIFLLILLIYSCSKTEYSSEFISQATGRYLFNSDEIITVYFDDKDLFINWHGAGAIKPMPMKNNTFFVKEMNEKIQFLTNPSDNNNYMILVAKNANDPISYNYKKLTENESIPSIYLKNNEFDKALRGYLAIQKTDSLDPNIKESRFNSLGYYNMRNNDLDQAIITFKINVALYPNSPNVYDSLGEALLKSGDSIQALENYKKSLELNSGNTRAKNIINQLKLK